MFKEEASELSGVDHAFPNADEKGFDVDTNGMTMGTAIDRALGLPLLDHRPVKQREKRAVVKHNGIMIEQGGDGRLVKGGRSGYQSRKLL